MKLKLNGKKGGKPKKSKAAPAKKTKKKPAKEAPAKKRRQIYGSASGPLSERASKVAEHLQTAMDLLAIAAHEMDTWNAADGNAIREVANSPDATIYWDHTMRELGRGISGRALLKDAAENAVKLSNQIGWYKWAFDTVAVYDAARQQAAKAEKAKPAKKKAAPKKSKKAAPKKAVPAKKKKGKKKKK